MAPPESIVIRPAMAEDAATFLGILSESIRGIASADYSAAVIEGWAPQVNEGSKAAFRKNPDNELRLIAELNNQAVGIGAAVCRA